MRQIAEAADVSVETVYVRFRNKRNLLDAFLDIAIVGDTETAPLIERPPSVRSQKNLISAAVPNSWRR